MLEGKKIALYVTGGISAYKAVVLLRELIKQGASVRVAMTDHATEFVAPLTFSVLSKHPVYTDTFDASQPDSIDHIALADWADHSIIAPATANVLSKVANGLADDFVSTSLIATDHPLFFVPAMNNKMYQNAAMQRNIKQLEADDHVVMTPDTGFLAEGYEGKGRFPVYGRIIDEFTQLVVSDRTLLAGKRFVITAGGTKEYIDPVRTLTNKSSGKMGHALADAATLAGAEVTLITTSQLPVSSLVEVIQVETAEQMLDHTTEAFQQADAVIMAAAVSDYRPENISEQKIKKQDHLTLELSLNPDILQLLGQRKKEGQFTIGFAAETDHLEQYAQDKLTKKAADMIIANDVSRQDQGFNVDQNEVTIFTKEGDRKHLPLNSKTALARDIIAFVAEYMKEGK